MFKNMSIKDEKILDLITNGEDRKVIPLLYENVLPIVEKYVLRNNGNKDDAFDVFQDALMVFYKQVVNGVFDPKYKVFGYLYKVSINNWINKVKKNNRLVLVDETLEVETEDSSEKVSVPRKNDADILDDLFSTIGEKCIDLLKYTIYSNMLLEDIMLRMGFPTVSSVKMQHKRCKQKLLKLIDANPELKQKLLRDL